MSTLLLSEEERMLQQSVRQFAQTELAPRAAEVGEQEEFVESVVAERRRAAS